MPVQKNTGFPTQPHHQLHVLIGTFRKVHSQTWKPVFKTVHQIICHRWLYNKTSMHWRPALETHWRKTSGQREYHCHLAAAKVEARPCRGKSRGSHHASCTFFHTPAGSILLDHNLVLHFRSNTVARATTTLRIKSNLFGGGRWVGNFLGDCKL